MAIQYTLNLGDIGRNTVRTTTPELPSGVEIVVIIGDIVEATQGYQKSRISETIMEIANRHKNATEYGFTQTNRKGLAKRIDGANSLAYVRIFLVEVEPDEVAVLIPAGVTQHESGILYETIAEINKYYLETDGMN